MKSHNPLAEYVRPRERVKLEDFCGRPASQTNEVQDGSQQTAMNVSISRLKSFDLPPFQWWRFFEEAGRNKKLLLFLRYTFSYCRIKNQSVTNIRCYQYFYICFQFVEDKATQID